jgi:hypothetical protein
MSSKNMHQIKPRRNQSIFPPMDNKKSKAKSCPSLSPKKIQTPKLSAKLVIERSPLDTPSKEERQMEIWNEFIQKRSEIVFLNALMKLNYEQEGV